MAFVILEDTYGFVELVVFPELYKKSAELLKQEVPVLVNGQVDIKDDKSNIIANEIISLDELRKKSITQFHVKLPIEEITSEDLENLHRLFTTSTGECSLYLHLLPQEEEEEVVLKAGPPLQVDPSEELIMEVEKRLGKGTVLLER